MPSTLVVLDALADPVADEELAPVGKTDAELVGNPVAEADVEPDGVPLGEVDVEPVAVAMADVEPDGVPLGEVDVETVAVAATDDEPVGVPVAVADDEPDGVPVAVADDEPDGVTVAVADVEPVAVAVAVADVEPVGVTDVELLEPDGVGVDEVDVAEQSPDSCMSLLLKEDTVACAALLSGVPASATSVSSDGVHTTTPLPDCTTTPSKVSVVVTVMTPAEAKWTVNELMPLFPAPAKCQPTPAWDCRTSWKAQLWVATGLLALEAPVHFGSR